jgi:hypothetical protein
MIMTVFTYHLRKTMKTYSFRTTLRRRLMTVLWSVAIACYGCNFEWIDNSQDDETNNGNLSFQLTVNRPFDQTRPSAFTADIDICQYFNISTIQATVYNADQTSLATDTWACSDHQGTLTQVPAGKDYRLVVEGSEADQTQASWTGEATGITVSANTETNVGEIALVYAGPLQAPESVTVTPGDSLAMVSWHAVRQATGYAVYWSTASDVSPSNYEGTMSDIPTTYATIQDLTNQTTYYFIVASQNSAGEGSPSAAATTTPVHTARTLDRISLSAPGGTSGEFGWGVTSGDFNGDGLIDIAVSDPVYDGTAGNTGAVFIYLGDTAFQTTPSQTLEDPEGVQGNQFGFYVSGVGDTNADGFDDLLVAMGWNVDKAYLLYGSASGLSTGNLIQLLPPDGYDGYGFGHNISGGGDINGDGYNDFVMATGGGYGCIYYGSSSGMSSQPNHLLSIGNAVSNSYVECAVIGDINQDGYADVALNNRSPGPTNATNIFIYHGSASGVNTPNDTFTIYLNEEKEYGFSVAITSAGDFSGDGFDDMLIGNQWATYTEINQGEGRLYFGSSLGVNDSALILHNPYQTYNSRFGNSVAGIGDFNYDGFDDVIIGCPNGVFAEVYFGEKNPSSDVASLTIEGTGRFGWWVSKAGDIRGTGENFIVIGSEFGAAEVAAMHNDKPTANAGLDQSAGSDLVYQLDGRHSSDGDSDVLAYQWTITSSPAGSSPELSDAQSPTPLLYMDLPGKYIVELVVHDNIVESDPDQVEVTRN